jgi:excisionase family DNA binding protein
MRQSQARNRSDIDCERAMTSSNGSAIRSIAEVLAMNKRETGNGNQPPHEEAVDSRTAAVFLGIHYKTLERMARMGQVPAMKLGKEWQFLLSLLNEWRKEQMTSNQKHPTNKNEQKESSSI